MARPGPNPAAHLEVELLSGSLNGCLQGAEEGPFHWGLGGRARPKRHRAARVEEANHLSHVKPQGQERGCNLEQYDSWRERWGGGKDEDIAQKAQVTCSKSPKEGQVGIWACTPFPVLLAASWKDSGSILSSPEGW